MAASEATASGGGGVSQLLRPFGRQIAERGEGIPGRPMKGIRLGATDFLPHVGSLVLKKQSVFFI